MWKFLVQELGTCPEFQTAGYGRAPVTVVKQTVVFSGTSGRRNHFDLLLTDSASQSQQLTAYAEESVGRAVTSDSGIGLNSGINSTFCWNRNWTGMRGDGIGIGSGMGSGGLGIAADSSPIPRKMWIPHISNMKAYSILSISYGVITNFVSKSLSHYK